MKTVKTVFCGVVVLALLIGLSLPVALAQGTADTNWYEVKVRKSKGAEIDPATGDLSRDKFKGNFYMKLCEVGVSPCGGFLYQVFILIDWNEDGDYEDVNEFQTRALYSCGATEDSFQAEPGPFFIVDPDGAQFIFFFNGLVQNDGKKLNTKACGWWWQGPGPLTADFIGAKCKLKANFKELDKLPFTIAELEAFYGAGAFDCPSEVPL